jgi:hypothetical protein
LQWPVTHIRLSCLSHGMLVATTPCRDCSKQRASSKTRRRELREDCAECRRVLVVVIQPNLRKLLDRLRARKSRRLSSLPSINALQKIGVATNADKRTRSGGAWSAGAPFFLSRSAICFRMQQIVNRLEKIGLGQYAARKFPTGRRRTHSKRTRGLIKWMRRAAQSSPCGALTRNIRLNVPSGGIPIAML